MSRYKAYLKCDKMKGSTKVAGFEQAITLMQITAPTVDNRLDSSRAAPRTAGEPDFAPVLVKMEVGKDCVESLQAMAKGENIGKVEFLIVESHHKDAQPKVTITSLNTYVTFWGISFEPQRTLDADPGNNSPISGTGVIVTVEFTGTELQIEYAEVGQDQQAKGKVTAKYNRLNQDAS